MIDELGRRLSKEALAALEQEESKTRYRSALERIANWDGATLDAGHAYVMKEYARTVLKEDTAMK